MEETLDQVKCHILHNIRNDRSGSTNHDTEREQIFTLLSRTIEHGESNSALLIGPRFSGKTSLINSVLSELEESSNFKSNAQLVRLNGLIHTDDRLALVAATTQMDLESAVNGKVFLSFAENLSFLLACLKAGDKTTSKSIIFVLEEFDLFCGHHNQTLLYNLFDVSQSAQAPICVIGITCRFDVIELLEKRVKSRFSHRQYFLFFEDDLDARMSRIEELLILEKNAVELPTDFIKEWNKKVKRLIGEKKLRATIRRLLDVDLNEDTLKQFLILIITSLNDVHSFPTAEDFENRLLIKESDEIVAQILDLSILELCLLIAMKHHVEIYDDQAMNFEMIYTRYLKFASTTSNLQNVQRVVVMKAFEHIQSAELIQAISGTAGRLQKEYQMFRLLVTTQQITSAAKKWSGLPTEVAQWAISSLI